LFCLAVYLVLFSASYYLHSPSTASGARYRRSACIDIDVLRLAAVACCDVGWILAQRGVLRDWTVSKKLEAWITEEGGHFEHLLWHCLPDIPVATHHNRFFSEPPMTTHNWLFSEPPTSERTQQTFSQMTKFRNIHKLVWWHFQVGWASGLQIVFLWDNVNNQKYVWIILLKMTFSTSSGYIWQERWTICKIFVSNFLRISRAKNH